VNVEPLLLSFNALIVRLSENGLHLNKSMFVTMARSIFVLLYWTHLLGCGFFFVGQASSVGGEATGWLSHVDGGALAADDALMSEQYVVSVLWSMATLTGLGSEIEPANQAERVYGIFVHLVAIFIFAFVIGGITDALAETRLSETTLSKEMAQVSIAEGTRVHFHRYSVL
jgi:hypothetical protein